MAPFALLIPLALAQDPPATWSPLRVALDCQSGARVRACAFLRTYVDEIEVLAYVPRAEADVIVYLNVTEEANTDLVHLRYVRQGEGSPAELELVQPINTRTGDDEQRLALKPAFVRGIAPFVAATIPDAVTVSIAAPPDALKDEPETTPWGLSLYGGGWGSWTENYQSLSVWDGIYVYRLTNTRKLQGGVYHSADVSRQPSLSIDEHEVSLDSSSVTLSADLLAAWNLGEHWSVGGVLRGAHQDPEGQYRWTGRAHAGLSWDAFPSDDPRGNQLALAWLVCVQADAYNQENQLGELSAVFPTQGLVVDGTVRKDMVEFSLSAGLGAELLHPARRYVLSADGDVSVALGDHVDLSVSSGVTRQAIPGPADIDASNYEEVTRASYAEPLDIWGNLSLRVHWDNTNGARNNRFDVVPTSGTSNL